MNVPNCMDVAAAVTLRHTDIPSFVISGNFLSPNHLDLIIIRGQFIEYYRVDQFSLVLLKSKFIATKPLNLKSIAVRDRSIHVFDDLEFDNCGPELGYVHPFHQAGWNGLDVVVLITECMVMEIFAATASGDLVEFITLRRIPVPGRPFLSNHHQLGVHVATHARSIAITSFQNAVFLYQSNSPILGLIEEEVSPNVHNSMPPDINMYKIPMDDLIIWHMFFLEPNPMSYESSDLVVIGVPTSGHKLIQLALIKVGEQSCLGTNAGDAVKSDPSFLKQSRLSLDLNAECTTIEAAFPLPYKPNHFCVVLNHEIVTLSSSDFSNNDKAVFICSKAKDRHPLPTTRYISGFATISDRISEYNYLIDDRGQLFKSTTYSSHVIRQSPQLRDAQLVYIGREMLDEQLVDIVMATCYVSNWVLLIIGSDFVRSVDIHESLSPVTQAIIWPSPSKTLSKPSRLGGMQIVVAAKNQLVQLVDFIPFIVDSVSEDVHDGLMQVFMANKLIVMSFNAESRVLCLMGNELVDISSTISAWDLTCQTLLVHHFNDTVVHITSHCVNKYLIENEVLPTSRSWRMPAESRILSCTGCGDKLLVVTCSDHKHHKVTKLDLDTLSPNEIWASDWVEDTPTAVCLGSSGDAWIGTVSGHVICVGGRDVMQPLRLNVGYIPNAIVIDPDTVSTNLLIGTRCGRLVLVPVEAAHSDQSGFPSTEIGVGPVQLVNCSVQNSELLPSHSGVVQLPCLAICDGHMFVISVHVNLVIQTCQVDVSCTAAVEFMNSMLVITNDFHLMLGRLGTGMAMHKTNTEDQFIPRCLLSCLHGTALLACDSHASSSTIRVYNREIIVADSLKIDQYITSWCEWPPSAARPRIILGTALTQNNKIIGGHYFVYQFHQHSLRIDASPFKSPRFAGPVRAVVAMLNRSFAFAVGRTVMLHALNSVTKVVGKVQEVELQSVVTATAVFNTILAVGTARDSVVLLTRRESSTNQHSIPFEIIGRDTVARHITSMVWARKGDVVLAADRNGCIVGLALGGVQSLMNFTF